MQSQIINPALESLKWLIGKWVCKEGLGSYPTMPTFKYCEEIEFVSFGQPLLQYTAKSHHPEKKTPMHYESGFLRIKPGSSSVAFMVAHNFGLVTLEEGNIDCEKILLKSANINRMSFAKDPAVVKVERHFSLKDNKLEQILFMETADTPLTEHLRCLYEKTES